MSPLRQRASSLVEALLDRLHRSLVSNFPERQVYIRSSGRVQFFTFSATLQATLAGLSLIFLGWTAFATVNVVFKERIIVEREQRYQWTQSAYENRVANLQFVTTQLTHALASAENGFESAVAEVGTKQSLIQGFLDRKQQTDNILRGLASRTVGNAPKIESWNPSGVFFALSGLDRANPSIGSGFPNKLPSSAQSSPVADSAHSRLGYLHHVVSTLVDNLFGWADSPPSRDVPANMYKRYPELRLLARQTARIGRISMGDDKLLALAQANVATGVAEIRTLIGRTGIDPDAFVRRTSGAEGGPEIPLQDVHVDGITDPKFVSAYLQAAGTLDQLDQFLNAISHIPLTIPVSGVQFERTSGFGPRRDPFTGHLAFHPGLDFAGPLGSIVRTTAPGRVVWAAPRGGYGNMVEIDHGFGLHTRYAHLEMILVKVGDQVAQGSPVGKLGSTGRSTGPHVHYEVWFDNVVRDPANFIDAIHGRQASIASGGGGLWHKAPARTR